VRIAPKNPLVCSTTTTVVATTTTTTLDPCGGLAGMGFAACRLDAASTAPLCSVATVDATLASVLHARFAAVATIVRRAADATKPRRRHALLRRADARLRALVPKVRRAGRRGILDPACRAEIEASIASLRQAVGSP